MASYWNLLRRDTRSRARRRFYYENLLFFCFKGDFERQLSSTWAVPARMGNLAAPRYFRGQAAEVIEQAGGHPRRLKSPIDHSKSPVNGIRLETITISTIKYGRHNLEYSLVRMGSASYSCLLT